MFVAHLFAVEASMSQSQLGALTARAKVKLYEGFDIWAAAFLPSPGEDKTLRRFNLEKDTSRCVGALRTFHDEPEDTIDAGAVSVNDRLQTFWGPSI